MDHHNQIQTSPSTRHKRIGKILIILLNTLYAVLHPFLCGRVFNVLYHIRLQLCHRRPNRHVLRLLRICFTNCSLVNIAFALNTFKRIQYRRLQLLKCLVLNEPLPVRFFHQVPTAFPRQANGRNDHVQTDSFARSIHPAKIKVQPVIASLAIIQHPHIVAIHPNTAIIPQIVLKTTAILYAKL